MGRAGNGRIRSGLPTFRWSSAGHWGVSFCRGYLGREYSDRASRSSFQQPGYSHRPVRGGHPATFGQSQEDSGAIWETGQPGIDGDLEEAKMGVIRTELEERWVWIILNRPDKRNALNPDLISELEQ